jgi:hypothetical protein
MRTDFQTDVRRLLFLYFDKLAGHPEIFRRPTCGTPAIRMAAATRSSVTDRGGSWSEAKRKTILLRRSRGSIIKGVRGHYSEGRQ